MRGEDGIIDKMGKFYQRITPACAGKTDKEGRSLTDAQDHPRMRGEDEFTGIIDKMGKGSPPHARGRPVIVQGMQVRTRITPACAGKTSVQCKNNP